MEVKRKAIGVALSMVTSRNVEEVVLFLKKQLQNTVDQDFDKVSLRNSSDLVVVGQRLILPSTEPRVPTTSHSVHSHLRHQVL